MYCTVLGLGEVLHQCRKMTMTKVQVVDSMSSVLDIQVLAIEKTLLSIDRFLETNLGNDIAKLITSLNISLRSMVSKALEKSSSNNLSLRHMNSDRNHHKPTTKNTISSKHFGSPNRFRQSSQRSKLERAHRWRVFLSDDPDFRRFLELPCKKMVRHLDSMRLRLHRKNLFDKWKDAVGISRSQFENESLANIYNHSDQETPTRNQPNNHYDQEFMWEDPSFNPYEEDEEEKLPSYEEVQEEDLLEKDNASEVFYAADGRPLDVDELHSFQPINDTSSKLQLSQIESSENDIPEQINTTQRPRFNFDNTSLTSKITTLDVTSSLATEGQGSKTTHTQNDILTNRSLQLADMPTSSIGISSRPTFSVESLLEQSRSLPPASQSYFHPPISTSTNLYIPQMHDHTSFMALRQSSWHNSSNLDDDRDMDEGFELPP